MAKYSSSIHYKISTSLDAAGITKLQAELNKLEHELGILNKRPLIGDAQTQQALRDINRIQNALKQAFNPRLGMVNSRVLMNELTKGGRSLTDIYNSLGTRGTSAMAQLYGQLGKIDTGMKSVSKTTDKIFNTLGNTVRWGVIASGFQYVLNGAHSAVQYMADLDKSLTNIRLVTDESKESMRQFAQYANDAAKSLGSTTVAYTDAALIYAQQGYGLQDQKTLANYTLMTANATGQDTAEVSEQMTALINGFQLSVEDVGSALDVMAKVANTSAADLEELATAASKVASTANTLGVTQEQLTAQIATIVSVTREAPENVGNALKTIYARFGDLKLGETLEDGTDLGKVSSTLEKIGVQVLDSSGAMRDMGLIMEDLMEVWDTLDTATKQGAAVTLAGKYQYNRLMALMENSDMYEGYYDDAINSAGTLEEMQLEYMDSLEGKANVLKASFEGLLTNLFNQDDFGVILEGLTEVIDGFNSLIDVIGGSSNALTAFGAIGMNVFSNQIGRGISNVISNREKSKLAAQNIDTAKAQSQHGMLAAGVSTGSLRMQNFGKDLDNLRSYAGIMNDDQLAVMNQKIDEYAQSIIKAEQSQKEFEHSLKGVKAAFAELGIETDGTTNDIIAMLQRIEVGDAKLEDLEVTLGQLSDKVSNTQMAMADLANSFKQLDASADLDDSLLKIITGSDKLKNNLQELIPVFKEVGLQDKEIKALEQTIKKLGDTANGTEIDFVQFRSELEQAGLSIDDFRVALQLAIEKGEITSQVLEELRQKFKNAAFAADGTRASFLQTTNAMSNQAIASNVANLASGLMSLAFAVQSIQSLGSIWEDEDLELGEKIGQTLLSGTMIVSMLAMAYVELSTAIKELGAAHAIEALALKVSNADMLAKIGLTEGATKATLGLGNALKILARYFIPIIAVTAALGFGINALVKAYNKEADAAEAAREDAKAAKQAYQDLNTEYQNLTDNIANYQDARNALSELTKGTEEWQDAVHKTNEEVLNLLDTYPELAKYISRSDDGILSISQEGLEAFSNQKEKQLSAAERASYAADIAANQAEMIAQETSVRRQVDWMNVTSQGVVPMSLSESQMNLLESGYNSGVDVWNAEDVANLFRVDVSDPMVTAIVESSDKLISHWEAKETQAAADRIKQEQIMQGLLNEQIDYNADSISNNDALLSALVDMSDTDSQEYQRALENYQSLSTEDVARAYAAKYGFDANTIDVEGHNPFTSSDDTITMSDAEGIEHNLSRSLMENTLAGADAMNAAADKWNAVADKLLGINENTTLGNLLDGKSYDLMSSWQAGGSLDVSGLTDSQLNEAKTLIDANGGSFSVEQLFGDMSTQEVDALVADWGFESGESFAQSFSNGFVEAYNRENAFEATMAKYADSTIRADSTRNWGGENPEYDVTFGMDGVSGNVNEYNARKEEIFNTMQSVKDLNQAYTDGLLLTQDYNAGLQKLGDTQGVNTEIIQKNSAAQKKLTEAQEKAADTTAEDYPKALEELAKAQEEAAQAQEALEDALFEKEWQRAASQVKEYDEALKAGTIDLDEYKEKINNVLSDVMGFEMAEGFTEDLVTNHKALIDEWIAGDAAAASKIKALATVSTEESKALLASVGLTAGEVQGYIDGLTFHADGTADFSDICAELGILDAEGNIVKENLNDLAILMASIGNSSLTFSNKGGEIKTLDTSWASLLQSSNPFDVIAGYAGYQVFMQEVAALKGGGWSIIGDVPAGAPPKTSPVGSPGGSPKSSGGGGGGGGGSSYTPKKEKPLEEEPDRYQDVNAHLDRLSNNLDKIADEQDRLTGKALLDNMQKQVDLIQEQTDWHQKKLEIQQQEAAELRKELGADYGLTFDANGYIENYETTHQQLIDEYNALVDQYNNTSDEEGQEKLKEKMDAVKEKIDKFNEGWERYDELMNNEIPDSIKTLEDLEDQIEDLRIEAFNAAVEAADNIKEVQDAWAEYMGFMSGLHPDSPFRALTEDAMKYENALDSVTAKQEDLDQLMKWLPQYQPGGVITSDNPFGENSAEFYEALQTAYESYIEAALEAEQLYYDQIDDVIEGYDDIADRIEKRMENYARLTEQLDHYASVIETLYGEEDYDNLLAIKRANQDVLESSIEQQRANLAMWQNELAKYNKETQPEIWEAIHEQVIEAEDELNGLVEEAAENTAAILEMAVDKTVKEWKDTMLGGDADWMETQWELIKQNADQYLDTVEETYELEKLRSKYNSLANDTADLNLRKRINDQMEKELAYLKEKDKLSEYDVNYANAKLEILQKQIALEEAQANKNQMKLRRDSQGNYSYVYTANQDDVENARNDLLDSEFNAYSMSKENYLTNYDNYIAAISAAAEQIKAINADTLLDEEEKAERTQWIYDNLKQYLSGIAEQIGVSEQGMLESVKYLAMDSSEIVGQNYADIAAMMEENWTEALGVIGVAVSEEFDYIIHNMDEFLDKTQEKWKEFEEHTQEWADNVNDIADDGTDGFRDIDDVIIDINNDMKELNEETEDFFALINDDLGTIDKAVGKLADYEKQLLGLKESTSKVRAELEEARAEILEKENEIRNLRNELKAAQDKNNGSGGDSGSGGSGGSGSDENKAASIATEALEIVKGVHYGTIANGSGGWRPSAREAGYSEDAISIALTAFNDSKAGGGYSYYYNKALELVKSYDTGGYTGIWGKEGRLAMLHQKELVLNASDTSNILAAVSAIREIVSVMKADSISSMLSIGRNSNIATNTGNNIQQNVEIYADFPAAESAAEIKAALEGLAQQAIQYSMRTR